MTKRTFFSLLYALICTVSFGQKFAHPGMLHVTSDLEFMKAKILASEESWKKHGANSSHRKLLRSIINQLLLRL